MVCAVSAVARQTTSQADRIKTTVPAAGLAFRLRIVPQFGDRLGADTVPPPNELESTFKPGAGPYCKVFAQLVALCHLLCYHSCHMPELFIDYETLKDCTAARL